MMRKVRIPVHNPGWEMSLFPFSDLTPEESDDYDPEGVLLGVLTVWVRFIHPSGTPSHLSDVNIPDQKVLNPGPWAGVSDSS